MQGMQKKSVFEIKLLADITSARQRKTVRPGRVLVHDAAYLIHGNAPLWHFQNYFIVHMGNNVEFRLF